MWFKYSIPSLGAFGLAALLAFHPLICTAIVVGALVSYGIYRAVLVSQMIQEDFERGQQAQINPTHTKPVQISHSQIRVPAVVSMRREVRKVG